MAPSCYDKLTTIGDANACIEKVNYVHARSGDLVLVLCFTVYIAGYFCGVLSFVIFVVNL